MLKIKFKDNRQPAFWVMEKSYSIGSAKENHLCIDDSSVSANHARLIREGEVFTLRDLAGSSGTYVNGQPISNCQISCGDTINVGQVSLEIIDPLLDANGNSAEYWSLIADSSWLTGQEFPLPLKMNVPITLGRGTQCDLVIPSTHLSRQHAQITLTETGVFLEDLNSANGTYVNDKKTAAHEIRPGDRVRFDVYSFRVFGPGINLPKAATTSFNIAVKEAAPVQRKTVVKPPSKSAREKMWKTRPTSPGNREEPRYNRAGKIIGWVFAIIIIAIFASIAYFVLSST